MCGEGREEDRERGRGREGGTESVVCSHYEKKSAPGLKDDGSDILIIREF